MSVVYPAELEGAPTPSSNPSETERKEQDMIPEELDYGMDANEVILDGVRLNHKMQLGHAVAFLLEQWKDNGGSLLTAVGVLEYVKSQVVADITEFGPTEDND